MNDTANLNEPPACSAEELREFERLVRLGFQGSDEGLSERIRDAHRLAVHRAPDGTPAAIAALKAPGAAYREALFRRAGAGPAPAACRLELGWVFVLPENRRRGIATALCHQLLGDAPPAPLFATTRPDNRAMLRILTGLGFRRRGRPYRHLRRDEELLLLVRPGPAVAG